MYKKMLVALDTSHFAEGVLEQAEATANKWEIPEVDLLTVLEPIRETAVAEFGAEYIQETETKDKENALEYLTGIRHKLSLASSEVKAFVVVGHAADEILKFVDANGVDLVVMSTHGRSGVSRWFLGSVAEKVVRRSNATVLLVPSHAARADTRS